MSHLCDALAEHPTPVEHASVTTRGGGYHFAADWSTALRAKRLSVSERKRSPRVSNRLVFRADRKAKLAGDSDV